MMCEIDGLCRCMPLVGSELSALRTNRGCLRVSATLPPETGEAPAMKRLEIPSRFFG